MQTNKLGTTAHDLLEMKRKVIEKEKQEIKKDISNVVLEDSFDETVFKIFEQIKAYVQGDEPKTINWKATSRRFDLMVNQYQEEKSQNQLIYGRSG